MYESMLNFPGAAFGDFARLRRELDDWFGAGGPPSNIRSVAPGTFPAINIGNTPASVEIYAFAPGIDPSKVEVVVDRGVLTLSGERTSQLPDGNGGNGAEANDKKVTVYSRERVGGRFRRAISLPEDVDAAQVSATYRDGVLRISVPRRESAQPKRINIQ
jgi:HSP20 family protein